MQTVDGRRAARRRQVAFAIVGTLVAAVLVASLGDSSAHKAYLAAKKTQETQIAGSWAVDHKQMDSTGVKAKDENKADVKQFMKTEQQQQALSRLQAKHEADTIAKVYQGTQLQFYAGAKPENEDDSGIGDKKPADLFGEASGSSGNGYEPEFEPSDDADVGLSANNSTICTVLFLYVFSWCCELDILPQLPQEYFHARPRVHTHAHQ